MGWPDRLSLGEHDMPPLFPNGSARAPQRGRWATVLPGESGGLGLGTGQGARQGNFHGGGQNGV